MKIIQLFILFSIFLASGHCKVVSKTSKTAIIELEKMKCRGACPVFTLKIYKNGDAFYQGSENVEMLGNYKSKLTKEQLRNVMEKFNKTDFFSFADSYKSNMMDLQTKFITYRQDGREKKIKAYDNIPKKLNSLIISLDSLISTLKWEKFN